jgi:hypothetical protein
MAITVGTDCYLTLVEADAYFAKRLDTDAWDALADADKEIALKAATHIIDNKYSFLGQSVSPSQALAWPREGVVYLDPRTSYLTTVGNTVYPTRLLSATCEQALHMILNPGLMSTTEQTFERIKVGPIELEDNSADYKPVPVVPSWTKELLDPLLRRSTSNRAVFMGN